MSARSRQAGRNEEHRQIERHKKKGKTLMSEIEKLAMRIRNGILEMPWTRAIKSSLYGKISKGIDAVVLKELQKFFEEQQERRVNEETLVNNQVNNQSEGVGIEELIKSRNCTIIYFK